MEKEREGDEKDAYWRPQETAILLKLKRFCFRKRKNRRVNLFCLFLVFVCLRYWKRERERESFLSLLRAVCAFVSRSSSFCVAFPFFCEGTLIC